MSLQQVLEKFFNDDKALVNMVRKLAETVAKVAETQINKLEKQLEE
jgi:hypothetical protein